MTMGQSFMKVDNNKSDLPAYQLSGYFTKTVPLAWWPVLAALAVHFSMLFNGFLSDDYVHLYNVSNFPFLDAISQRMGGHILYSYTAVVWLVKSLFGLNPFVFFLLGLTIHLASVRLLFEIISRLTARESLAAFGAALWGMSPISTGSLGWISVHGQVYATAAILWVLFDTIRYSKTPSLLKNSVLIRQACLLLVAATSFGAGLSSTVLYPLVIALWNPLPNVRTRLVLFYGSIALVAIVLYVFTMNFQNEGHGKFDLIKHSVDNFPRILRLFAGLLVVGTTSFFFGPLIIGKISLVPVASLPSVAAMIAVFTVLPVLVLGCLWSRLSERRQIFALLLLPCAVYGLISVARSSAFFSTTAGTARYHYFAQAILAIVACLLLARLIDRLPDKLLKYGRTAFFVWLVLAIFPFALGQVIDPGKDFRDAQDAQYKSSVLEIKTAIESNTGQEPIFIVNKPYKIFIWGYTPVKFPGFAALFVLSYPSNIVNGKRVLFLESSRELVDKAKAQQGSRISELLVYAPDRVK